MEPLIIFIASQNGTSPKSYEYVGVITDQKGKRFFILRDIKTGQEGCFTVSPTGKVVNEKSVQPGNVIKVVLENGVPAFVVDAVPKQQPTIFQGDVIEGVVGQLGR